MRRLDGMSLHEQGADLSGLALRGEVVSVSCNDVYSFSKPTRDEIVLIPGLGIEGDVHAGATVKHRGRVRADPTQPNLRQVHLIHAELHDDLRPEGYDVPPGGLGENVTTTGLDLLNLPRGTILRFGDPATASRAGTGEAATSEPATGEAALGAAAVIAAAQATTLDEPSAAAVAALAAQIQAERARIQAEPARAQAERARIQAEPAQIQAEQASGGADPASGAGPTPDTRPAIVLTGLRNPCQQINDYRPGLLRQVLGRDERGDLVRKAGVMAVVLWGGAIRPGDLIVVDLPRGPYLPLDRV